MSIMDIDEAEWLDRAFEPEDLTKQKKSNRGEPGIWPAAPIWERLYPMGLTTSRLRTRYGIEVSETRKLLTTKVVDEICTRVLGCHPRHIYGLEAWRDTPPPTRRISRRKAAA